VFYCAVANAFIWMWAELR